MMAKPADWRGSPFFWWLFFGHAKKSHSPQPEGRAKPCRGPCPRVLHGASRAIR